MRTIPLHNRQKKIVAYALVDRNDYKKINTYSWYLTDQGYAKRRKTIRGQKSFLVLMHREILKAKVGQIVDHINSNRLDNRKINLRFCNKSQNSLNRPKRSDNTSGYKGVFWSKQAKRWYAKIKIGRKEHRSKDCKTKEEALKLHKELSKKYCKQFHYEQD